jgi:hypothetical protein
MRKHYAEHFKTEGFQHCFINGYGCATLDAVHSVRSRNLLRFIRDTRKMLVELAKRNAAGLWEMFKSVPARSDTIEVDFLHFPAGTSCFDIMHWFEDQGVDLSKLTGGYDDWLDEDALLDENNVLLYISYVFEPDWPDSNERDPERFGEARKGM